MVNMPDPDDEKPAPQIPPDKPSDEPGGDPGPADQSDGAGERQGSANKDHPDSF
jgi:hypothetical protein